MGIVYNVLILLAFFSMVIFGRCPDQSRDALCASCENKTADCSNRCIGNSKHSKNYLTQMCPGKISEIYNIDLSFNELIRFECPVHGSSFQHLNISHNNVRFDNCSNWERYCESFFRRLRTIDLSYNRIQQTCNASAFPFSKLENANLSHNDIKSLDNLPFVTSAKRLQTLDLSHNMISCIPSTFFIEKQSLIKVDLGFNFIQKIALHFDISDQRLCDSDNQLYIILSGDILSKLDVSYISEKNYTCSELRNQTLCDGTVEYHYDNSNNMSCNLTSEVLKSTSIPSNLENQLECRCQGNICEQNENSILDPSRFVSCVNIDVTYAPLITTGEYHERGTTFLLISQPQETSETNQPFLTATKESSSHSITQTVNTTFSMNVVIISFFFVVIFMVITIVFVCLSIRFVTKNVLETAKHCPQDSQNINPQYGPKLGITANLGTPSTQNTSLFEEYDEIPFAADDNLRRGSVSDGKHMDESLDRSVSIEQPIDVANLARDDVMCCEALPIVQTLQRNPCYGPSETEIDRSEMNIVDLSLSTEDAENGIFQTKADIEPRGNLSSHSSKLSRGFVVPASLVMSDNTEELPGTVSDLLKRNPCYQADTYSCKATLTNSESSRVTKSISELHLNVSAAEEVTESGTYSEPSPLIWSEHSQHPSDFDQTLSFKQDQDNDVVDHLSVKQTLQKNPCYSSNVQNSASSFTEQLDPEENGLGLSVHSPYSTIEEEDIDHSNELLYEDRFANDSLNPEQLHRNSQHSFDFGQTLSFKNDKDNVFVDHLSVKQTLQKNPCYSSNVHNSASSFTEQLDPEVNGLGLSVHSPYSTIEEDSSRHSDEILYEDPNPNPEQLDEALKNPSVDCCTSNESEKDHL